MVNVNVRAPKPSAKFADFKVLWDRLWMQEFGHYMIKDLEGTPVRGFGDDRRTELAVTIETLTQTLQKAQEEQGTTKEFRKKIVDESNKIFEALNSNNSIYNTIYRTVGNLSRATQKLKTRYERKPRALHPESVPEMTEFRRCVDLMVAELLKEPANPETEMGKAS